jgi:hypothetical protein
MPHSGGLQAVTIPSETSHQYILDEVNYSVVVFGRATQCFGRYAEC